MTGDRIAIETESRWDAMELLRRLRTHHSYLVQLGETRWKVCVRPERDVDGILPEVLTAVEEWATERHVESVVHVGERHYPIRG